ncbi:MAG TPA: ComEC/Rec2 family competence protein, partial [Ilumatobacteraceae bacterium]
MSRAYGPQARRRRHPLIDGDLVLVAASTVLGVWTRSMQWVVLAAGVVVVVRRRALLGALCVLLGLSGVWRSATTWAGAHPRHLGDFAGWVTIVGDPVPLGAGLRVTLEVEGERFDTWAYGSARRRLVDRQVGERVYVEGRRRPLTTQAHRAQLRHVVGRVDLSAVGDWHDGSRLSATSSRVRIALRHAAERAMAGDDAALFTGLVIGDDSRQSPQMVEVFRASGLSHLTAVSGENVAFIVAAAAPVLRRLRPWWRWATTLALISWFMMLTRFEPSVMRAGVMAIVATTGYVAGRDVSAIRALSCTVTVLALIDPMLVWSVGFWLSTGATAGVCLAGPRLAESLPGPQWLRLPLSVTLGAQVGVAVPS